jgi:hypothetical protein
MPAGPAPSVSPGRVCARIAPALAGLIVATVGALIIGLGLGLGLGLGPGAVARGASGHQTLRPRWRVVSHGGAATDGPYTILWSERRGIVGSVMGLYSVATGQWETVSIPAVCRHRAGRQSSGQPAAVGTDLDAPFLTTPVCAPLRVPSATSESTLQLDGRFAVLRAAGGVFLEHCATHLHQLLTDAPPWVTAAPGILT